MMGGTYRTPQGDEMIIPAFSTERVVQVYGDALALSQLVPADMEPLQFDAQSFMAGVGAALIALAADYAPLPSSVLSRLEGR